ncbi:hypothetical protein BU24DRAFT_410116 [Aaosphaeria arxii CBS 175.79]|uniref:Uncharacterized protein n=1 Tax=Aaosphaeria arxii CBS 175.79 TaxID=1450172 RepID=A0A6A5XM99_9PLEO|nr:uncharacterized protein BU24DRAFT_410116 [Aaosphaeria arxii CBS 175.79]KAF2014365.1 hypothetical protein BU24DRAFT_410116 [Aaosphaeria arxii CBS 175.79]
MRQARIPRADLFDAKEINGGSSTYWGGFLANGCKPPKNNPNQHAPFRNAAMYFSYQGLKANDITTIDPDRPARLISQNLQTGQGAEPRNENTFPDIDLEPYWSARADSYFQEGSIEKQIVNTLIQRFEELFTQKDCPNKIYILGMDSMCYKHSSWTAAETDRERRRVISHYMFALDIAKRFIQRFYNNFRNVKATTYRICVDTTCLCETDIKFMKQKFELQEGYLLETSHLADILGNKMNRQSILIMFAPKNPIRQMLADVCASLVRELSPYVVICPPWEVDTLALDDYHGGDRTSSRVYELFQEHRYKSKPFTYNKDFIQCYGILGYHLRSDWQVPMESLDTCVVTDWGHYFSELDKQYQ